MNLMPEFPEDWYSEPEPTPDPSHYEEPPMNEATELVTPVLMPLATRKPRTPRTPKVDLSTPMGMVALAVQQGAGIEQLNRLMDLQDRWEKKESEKAFVAALSNFKSEAIEIIKTKQVKYGQTSYKHAELAGIVEAATPALSRYGLSLRWTTDQQGSVIRVTAILQHVQGHAETVSLESPADSSGQKNALQAVASAITYLQRYTAMAILGLAAKDQDDDGRGFDNKNGSKAVDPGMPEEEFQQHLRNIRDAIDLNALHGVYTAAYKASGTDKQTQLAIVKAKDDRKAELQGGAA